jgi:hypothetical protein
MKRIATAFLPHLDIKKDQVLSKKDQSCTQDE